jgi:hypothetical protein
VILPLLVFPAHTVRANMPSQDIARTSSFEMGLTSAEGRKLECFKELQIIFYKEHENIDKCKWCNVLLVFYLAQALYMCLLCIPPPFQPCLLIDI